MALPNPLEAFTWGAGGARKTPEQIAREREIADAMLAQAGDTSPVGHWTQGAARVANALGGVMKERRANKAEAANASESQSRIAALLGGMGGQGASQFPPAPGGDPVASGGASAAVQPTDPNVGSTIDFARGEASGSALPSSFLAAVDQAEGGGDYDTLFGHAQREGGAFAGTRVSAMPISQALAFADPSGHYAQNVKGKIGRVATPMGRHQIVGATLRNAVAEMGLDPNAPFNRQTQDAVAAHLARKRIASADTMGGKVAALRSEWEGFKNVPDAQLQQIVADLESGASAVPPADPSAPAPIQVASLDPSIGMPDAGPVPPDYSNMGLTPEAWQAMNAPDGQPAPAPAPIAQAPAVAPQQQVAQALLPVTAGGTADAIHPGQMPPNAGMNPAILEALSSPYASDQERAIAGILLKQQMESQDPMRQLEMQKLQRELSAAPERKTAVINGRLVDTQTGQEVASFPEQPKPTSDIQEYEYAKERGYNGSFVDFQLAQKKAGASSTSVTVGEGNKFYEELDKSQAGIFGALSEAGVQGRSKLAQIDRLEGLLGSAETGGMAMIKQAAGEWGINTEGLSDIQAAQALINELVPQQRQPGSGPMSDADLALFKQSLPRLINQPGGNQTIIDTMRGITQYQIQMGQIADAVADRGMTPAQAREAIRALPNPLAAFGKPKEQTQAPSGVDPSLWNEMTPEERALWN